MARIFDAPQEFPRHADLVGGPPYPDGSPAVVRDVCEPSVEAVGSTGKIDVQTGNVSAHDHGPGRGGAEPVFVAREGATAEADGWLLVLVHDATTDGSDLVILDAADMAAAPVARITLPQRVPDGFHGNWVSDTSVPPPS